MSRFFGSFLFKLILTVIISIFIGFQLAKIDPGSIGIPFNRIGIGFKEYNYSFRKILGVEAKGDPELQSRIQNLLQDKQSLRSGDLKEGDYAIYVKDLKPGGKRNVYINSDRVYEAASLYKLFLIAAVFDSINRGNLTLDTKISAKLSHLEAVLGSVDFGYQDLSGDEVATYTVEECLDRISRISDNYAAIMLAEKVGWGAIQDAANELGATSTTIKNPITTSAEDIGLMLEKTYNGQMVSFEASEQTIDLLAKAQINNRIPAKLPKTDPSTGSVIKIAHKTGELSQVRNDAGIVFLEGNPYVIVLMTKNLKGEDEGIENLAEISRIVYEYYSAK